MVIVQVSVVVNLNIFQNLAISINWREKQEFVVKVGENQSFQTSTIFGQLNL